MANGEGVLLCPTHISDQSEYLLQPLEDPYVAGPTMACSLRKHCLAGLLPSLRPVTVDFFASTFDIAGKSEVRDLPTAVGSWPLPPGHYMQQVFAKGRSYHKLCSATLSASRQHAKCCCLLWQSTLLHISGPYFTH